MEPAYLSSIIVGEYYSKDLLLRALCDRISGIENLPEGFCHNPPDILHRSFLSFQKSEKPPMCGFCWVNGRGIEMINQQTGKLTNDGIPRLSKNVLRKRLEQLARPSSTPVQYQKAKETFYQYLEANGLGKWHKHTA